MGLSYREAQSDQFDALLAQGKFKAYRSLRFNNPAPAPAVSAFDVDALAQRVCQTLEAKWNGSPPTLNNAGVPPMDSVDAIAQRVFSMLEPKLQGMMNASAERIIASLAERLVPPPVSRPAAAEPQLLFSREKSSRKEISKPAVVDAPMEEPPLEVPQRWEYRHIPPIRMPEVTMPSHQPAPEERQDDQPPPPPAEPSGSGTQLPLTTSVSPTSPLLLSSFKLMSSTQTGGLGRAALLQLRTVLKNPYSYSFLDIALYPKSGAGAATIYGNS